MLDEGVESVLGGEVGGIGGYGGGVECGGVDGVVGGEGLDGWEVGGEVVVDMVELVGMVGGGDEVEVWG